MTKMFFLAIPLEMRSFDNVPLKSSCSYAYIALGMMKFSNDFFQEGRGDRLFDS